MNSQIQWKEAKSGLADTDDSDEFVEPPTVSSRTAQNRQRVGSSSASSTGQARRQQSPDNEPITNPSIVPATNAPTQTIPNTSSANTSHELFSHKQLNLSLKRNIVALADANLHKPRLNYANEPRSQVPFERWLDRAVVAISPNADLILFSGLGSNSQSTFVAKLRMEPINQYVTKALTIALDYNEQVTSLLCLPIMSSQKTALGLVDWTALVVGLSSGYVKFYTEQSLCLLSLKFCDQPVISLKCQTVKCNTNARSESHFASIVDELLILYKNCAFVADGIELYENLRIAKNQIASSGLAFEPAYDLQNLPSILNCHKWNIDLDSRDASVTDADFLGTRRMSNFDLLLHESVNMSERATTKNHSRTLAFVGRQPFLSCYRESQDSSGPSYRELFGSIFSMWNKPQQSRYQNIDISDPNVTCMFDGDRLGNSIVTSPDKRLAAICDDFGRVMLVDATNWLLVRLWKGYRNAQCGWIEVKRDPNDRSSPCALFLVIYAPKRGLLEIWSTQRGPRVAAFNVGKECRLLYAGHRMFNMRADTSGKLIEQAYSSQCYLLNAISEHVFAIELPYTYSLHKYDDLKSRDQLLITELEAAIQRDDDIEFITEILHRIALAEFMERSIRKIANNLLPDKIVALMENVINMTMKNYDNLVGESMTADDQSIIELSKRVMQLCLLFEQLSAAQSKSRDQLALPEVNRRLIDEYEEHPQEIDEFASSLGWPPTEVLRYLSLLSLERSYTRDHLSSPWPSLGEPLGWCEFVACFDLRRAPKENFSVRRKSAKNQSKDTAGPATGSGIKLKELNSQFLAQDKLVKTALFLWTSNCELFYKSVLQPNASSKSLKSSQRANLGCIEPPSRLALLFQFWLSTKLCNDWRLWRFLQQQVGQISDELKVLAMEAGGCKEEDSSEEHQNDKLLIDSWKLIYQLIVESENIFAALVGTASIRSDTIRMLDDRARGADKLLAKPAEGDPEEAAAPLRRVSTSTSFDWECLCIDAERMSFLSRQLEDVFLVGLLLRYSPREGHLLPARFNYRLARVSVSSIMRAGPAAISELVAQWAVQSAVELKWLASSYGERRPSDQLVQLVARSSSREGDDQEPGDQVQELLHHAKTAFPCSLDTELLLMHCCWELFRRWSSDAVGSNKSQHLGRALECALLLENLQLRYRLTRLAYKTFIERVFERLVLLVDSNSTLLAAKSWRTRDTIARRELSMSAECLEEFVAFCCNFSELMLSSSSQFSRQPSDDDEPRPGPNPKPEALDRERLLATDDWGWPHKPAAGATSLPAMVVAEQEQDGLPSVAALVELNKLANLVRLVMRLRLVKVSPVLLVGEESRALLRLHHHQGPQPARQRGAAHGANLHQERQRFARKCILGIVARLSERTSGSLHEGANRDGRNAYDEDDDEEENDDERNNDADDDRSELGSDWNDEAVDRLRLDEDEHEDEHELEPELERQDEQQPGAAKCLAEESSAESAAGAGAEPMQLLADLLGLASEWQLDRDELHLELAFELYRCDQDREGAQIASRCQDQATLAQGLLKIGSQRLLLLLGLGAQADAWAALSPAVAAWLRAVQAEEASRQLASLASSPSRPGRSLAARTQLLLQRATNHLEGPAGRLAYELLRLLDELPPRRRPQ